MSYNYNFILCNNRAMIPEPFPCLITHLLCMPTNDVDYRDTAISLIRLGIGRNN